MWCHTTCWERGAGAARDLEDEKIPCGLGYGGDGPGCDRNPANSAKEQRDYLKDWFNGAGAVTWQDAKAWLVSEVQEQIISPSQG